MSLEGNSYNHAQLIFVTYGGMSSHLWPSRKKKDYFDMYMYYVHVFPSLISSELHYYYLVHYGP